MKKKSIWKEVKTKQLKSIDKNMTTDVLIVGGGITGISVLHELASNNVNAILVERNICGHGATANSTAKITYAQESIYMNIRNLVGYDIASKYLKSQIEGTNLLKSIIDKENIDCNLKKVDSYVFTNSSKEKILEENEFYKNNNIDSIVVNNIPFDTDCKLAIKLPNTYVFHPLKYINYFKNKYKDFIYENSKVWDIKKSGDTYICQVNDVQVKCKYVVLAVHYPYFLLPFMMPLKSHIETSFIGASNVNKDNDFSAINIDKPSVSLRYHQDNNLNYLIYLYNSYISSNVKSIYKNFLMLNNNQSFDYVWSNNDIITNDYLPFIGRIKGNLILATGYNTWGFTNGTLAGVIIKDIILNKENEYIKLFDPKRSINLSKVIRFPIDVGSSIKAIIKSNRNNVNNQNVVYKKINNVDVIIYKDKKGDEHIVKNKCPHMKCGIVFNEVEKTWECLCHGSRFSLDGKCINGPSNYDITFNDIS